MNKDIKEYFAIIVSFSLISSLIFAPIGIFLLIKCLDFESKGE